jgi:pyridoxamine 5'-phosphate oxidase-like protein
MRDGRWLVSIEERAAVEISRAESLKLLSEVPIGRIVYTARALPAIFPARHVVEDGSVVVRTRVAAQCAGSVVAYEADEIDGSDTGNWCVVVTGVARQVISPAEVSYYDQILHPLIRSNTAELIRITPEIVAGYRMMEAPDY